MDGFKITKREIIMSASIVAIMLLIGVIISDKISDLVMDKIAEYNKAIKIESNDLFEYGMRTNVGNAFVYGDLLAVDTVTYSEIGGSYIYVEKVEERYTKHTRRVAHTKTVNGETQRYYTTETYWTWDRVGSENKKCKEILFLDCVIPADKIYIPEICYIDTIQESYYIRYKYYGTGTKFTGTIFTRLADGTIEDGTRFYSNLTIDETVSKLKTSAPIYIFWIIWIVLIGVTVYAFYFIDNRWLE